MGLDRFIALWCHPDYPPVAVSRDGLSDGFSRAGGVAPSDYASAVVECGLPLPGIALLDAIVDRDLDLHDVSDFFTPDVIVEQTHGWREIGLPPELVAFASDSMGNLFCFATEGDAHPRPVVFWDHDFGDVTQIAPTFDDWIDGFCRIESAKS